MIPKRAILLVLLILFPLQLLRLGNDIFPVWLALLGVVSGVGIYVFAVHRPIPLLAATAFVAYDYVIFVNCYTWQPPFAFEMFGAWVAAIMLLILMYTTRDDVTHLFDLSTRENKQYYAAIAGITLFGAILRFYNYAEIPVLNGDEAFIALFGMTYFDGTFSNPFTSGWLELPSLLIYIPGLMVQLFGQTIFALRLPNLILGVLAIPLCIWTVRPLLSRPFALMAGIVIASLGLHINFSRINYIIIFDMMCALAIIGLMLRSEKGFQTRDIISVGIIIGLGQFGYASARSLAILLTIWTVLQIIRLPAQWKTSLTHLILCGVVTVAVSGPLLLHYYQNPDKFRAPLQRASLILPDSPDGSSVLTRQMAEFNKSAEEIIFANLQRSFMAIITGPVDGWYRSNFAILPSLYAFLFLVGIANALWNWRSTRHNILLINIFMVCMTASLSYPVAAGHRMVSMLGSVCLLVGLGAQTLDYLRHRLLTQPMAQRISMGVLATVVAVGGYQSINHYFSTFITIENGAGDPAMQSCSQFARYAQKLPAGTKIDVYETDYLNRSVSGVVPFLTSHIDYVAVPEGQNPRGDAEVIVIPADRKAQAVVPAGYRVVEVRTNFNEPLLEFALAPSVRIEP
ncbi:MAG: hypothetical protein RL076_89 [Chloroflexota bacterium]